ncbi:hypothetical protein GCM10007978_12790 [Shewanella hanedai]|jgi:hypothetical protein|uniref:hypothetical protein n=1 Tax=Shewanella hanedai TaxID=25 RepID=UPI00163D8753|nr:hypothetical protein [Shewanella hanedai]GGI76590.1 hypothetical protein GCM10007978_12790 [Shewanella hanedai]
MKKLNTDNKQKQDEKFELIEEQLLNNISGGRATSCSEVCLPSPCFDDGISCLSE